MLERVSFLDESTGARTSALLNPDRLTIRRSTGVRSMTARPGSILGSRPDDDPVVLSGGGRTELDLELLFDVKLLTPVGDQTQRIVDVRKLTGPLWRLAENSSETGGPTPFRLLWGKYLNVKMVIAAIAERLECFGPDGMPQRSYLALRLLRLADAPTETGGGLDQNKSSALPATTSAQSPRAPLRPETEPVYHQVENGDGSAQGSARLDQLAVEYYGDASLWRRLAVANGLDNPPWPDPGQVLLIPPLTLSASQVGEGPGTR